MAGASLRFSCANPAHDHPGLSRGGRTATNLSRGDGSRSRPPKVSARLGPAFGESQGAGAERSAFALGGKRTALRLNSIDRQACPERRDQHRADTVFACRRRAWLGVDQQRLTDVIPSKSDLLVVRYCPLGPEIARIACLIERRVGHWNRGV